MRSSFPFHSKVLGFTETAFHEVMNDLFVDADIITTTGPVGHPVLLEPPYYNVVQLLPSHTPAL